MISNVHSVEMNSTGLTGEYKLYLELNGSSESESISLHLPYGSGTDAEAKQSEGFNTSVMAHELVFEEETMLSRWSFEEEANGSVIRDRGIARNHGKLIGDATLSPGKFGKALDLDGNGDYLNIPRFRGFHYEGNFTISAWVYLRNLGFSSSVEDASVFGTDGSGADTVLLWYNVNGSGTGNRTFTLNVGATDINLNRLDGPDGLAMQDRWQHVAAVMRGQNRYLYHDGKLVAESIGSDNLVTIMGNGVRLGSWSGSADMHFDGLLDEVRFYEKSFTGDEVSVLYGFGNGDLGLTPVISLESNNSSPVLSGSIQFTKFGEPVNSTGLSLSDLNVSGGQASNLIQIGNLYTFDLTPSTYPSRISIGLGEGAVSSGFSESIAVSQSFTQSQSLVNDESLALWYTFDELNGSIIRDLSGNDVHGEINAGILVPGKFASSLLLDPGEHLSVDSERLSLTTDFTLSLWAKILDDGHGVLVRNGLFSLQYNEDNSIRGRVHTNSGWGNTSSRLPSGRWVHYVLSYNGSNISLYVDGSLVSEVSHSGYLSWIDGNDHNLYLNRWATSGAGWEAKALYDELRIYSRALSSAEIDLLCSNGAGEMGIRPLVDGTSPFFQVPSSHSVSFLEGNQSVSIAGLLQSEVNATSASILNFDVSDYSFDLNVSTYPELVRIEIPHGAVEKDGNLSSAGAFEFYRRIITSVEDDLLAWYPMDDFNGSIIHDMSGRMRHGAYVGFDATSPGQGNITASASSSTYTAAMAFDNGGNVGTSRWLAQGNQLPNVWISYDFTQPIEITNYTIQSQSFRYEERAPKDWTLQGSNDNSNWTIVDTQSNQSGWGQWETRAYAVSVPGLFQYYKLVISDNNGNNTVGVGEIQYFTKPKSQSGKFGNAIDLTDDYINLPFKIDQSGSQGMTLSAWVYPRQVQGGVDNERIIFSTDNGGWDWTMSFRFGLVSAWTGGGRFQSSMSVFSNEWYHCVGIFDPDSSKTTLYLNGKPSSTNVLEFDGNSDFVRLGRGYWNRTFDGLIDDVRVWGRALSGSEVDQVWGKCNG